MSCTVNHFGHLIVVYLFSSCFLSSMDKSPMHSKDKDVKRKLFDHPSTDEKVIYTHINPPHFRKYMVHRFNASVYLLSALSASKKASYQLAPLLL